MKTKRRTVTALALVALAALVTLGVSRIEKGVHAQDVSPPQPDRISFGMVGITSGQTIRISVAHTIMPNDASFPPGPSRVVLNFRTLNGELARDRRGEVIRKVVDLERGDSTFLDLNYDEFPPGPTRLQLRAVVTVVPPPTDGSNVPPPVGDRTATTVEVINNSNGRTAFAISAPPSIQKLPPPQPE